MKNNQALIPPSPPFDKGGLGRICGFTLIEILVSLTILAIVMSILYGTFSASSANARIVEEKADELSSLTGALDVLSQEVRGAYYAADDAQEGFSGESGEIAFTSMTPFVGENEPRIQKVSYLFDGEKLIRKAFKAGDDAETKSESLLLEGVKEPSFSFFNGKDWVTEWSAGKNLPHGVRVSFSYKGKDVETVIPVLCRK